MSNRKKSYLGMEQDDLDELWALGDFQDLHQGLEDLLGDDDDMELNELPELLHNRRPAEAPGGNYAKASTSGTSSGNRQASRPGQSNGSGLKETKTHGTKKPRRRPYNRGEEMELVPQPRTSLPDKLPNRFLTFPSGRRLINSLLPKSLRSIMQRHKRDIVQS